MPPVIAAFVSRKLSLPQLKRRSTSSDSFTQSETSSSYSMISHPPAPPERYESTSSLNLAEHDGNTFLKGSEMKQLSRCCEMIEDVTPGDLRRILKSTIRKQPTEETQRLIIRGDHRMFPKKFVTGRKIRSLRKACPSIKQLVIENVNLRSPHRDERVRLEQFPSTLSMLSIRGCFVDTNAFLHTSAAASFLNIRVLDLGKIIDARGVSCEWPRMENLEELYLEGATGLGQQHFIKSILTNCPLLRKIDLEGTDVDVDVMVTMASYANNLEEIFLGYTNVRDSSIYLLNHCDILFRSLEYLCLANTPVTSAGVNRLRRSAPRLREVTVNRCLVAEDLQNGHDDDEDDIFLPLRVHRVHNVHIGAVFPDQGCGHFKIIHS